MRPISLLTKRIVRLKRFIPSLFLGKYGQHAYHQFENLQFNRMYHVFLENRIAVVYFSTARAAFE